MREALIALEVEGRLRIRVGSGIYVIEPQPAAVVSNSASIEGPFEILRARAFVESAIAEEAARLAKPEDIAGSTAFSAEAAGSNEASSMHDRRFHTAIAEILGNGVLVRCVGELFDLRINPYFERLARHTLAATAWRPRTRSTSLIRDAIAERDPARAREAMREHLRRSHQRFARDFGEQPSTIDLLDSMGEVKATA